MNWSPDAIWFDNATSYRRLARRKRARVTVTLRTRGSDGRLRRVTARLGLRR